MEHGIRLRKSKNIRMEYSYISKLVLLCFLLAIPVVLYPQEQPRRDRSKDHSLKMKSSKRNQTRLCATYLRVNNLFEINKQISFNGKTEVYYVDTDGGAWYISDLPQWCKVISQGENTFKLKYEPNYLGHSRRCRFKVVSYPKVVDVNIIQDSVPLPTNIEAHIDNVSKRSNVSNGKDLCLELHFKVTIEGGEMQKCLLVAWFTDESGDIIDANPAYTDNRIDDEGTAGIVNELTPYNDRQTYNVTWLFPYNALLFNQSQMNVTCNIGVYCVSTEKFLKGASYSFSFEVQSTN